MSVKPLHRPVSQIERELQAARYGLRRPQDLPNLDPLERAFGLAAGELAVYPESMEARAKAHEARVALEGARAEWKAHAQQNTLIRELETELSLAQMAARAEAIAVADAQLGQALDEYRAACLVTARALRKVLDAQRISSNVPGASHNIQSLRLHQFNIPSLVPASWQGTLGEVMMNGYAPFENTRHLEAA